MISLLRTGHGGNEGGSATILRPVEAAAAEALAGGGGEQGEARTRAVRPVSTRLRSAAAHRQEVTHGLAWHGSNIGRNPQIFALQQSKQQKPFRGTAPP
jgi:hypothetical protein